MRYTLLVAAENAQLTDTEAIFVGLASIGFALWIIYLTNKKDK